MPGMGVDLAWLEAMMDHKHVDGKLEPPLRPKEVSVYVGS